MVESIVIDVLLVVVALELVVVLLEVVIVVDDDVETDKVEELVVVISSILTHIGLSFIFPFLHLSVFIGLSSSKPGWQIGRYFTPSINSRNPLSKKQPD